jgi:hypothetical protein
MYDSDATQPLLPDVSPTSDTVNYQHMPPQHAANGAPPRPNGRGGKKLSRRGLLIGAGAVGVGAAAITTGILATQGKVHVPGIASGPPPTPAAHAQIAHLLRRAGFGARWSEIQQYSALGWTGAIDRLLHPDSVSDDLEQRLNALGLDLTRVVDEQRWWVLRMIYSQRPLQEKMTLFWHGLLTSSYKKVGGKRGYGYLITQNNFLRAHAFDTYDNILLGITQDPAMMWWLDLRLNRAQSPNENYARELMELFTLGVNSGYTQNDVHNAALALTGFKLGTGGTVEYQVARHDNSQKTLLGHTGNLDYHDVIRLVTSQPSSGPFLCSRIFRFFVHENPSDADLKPMVDAYTSNGHNLGAVMRAMFLSPAFISATAYRARLKSPVEFTLGAIRQLELELSGQGVATIMAQMGQTILDPPNVAGWPGDQQSAIWLNTGTWLTRVNFINTVLNGARATQGQGDGTPAGGNLNQGLQTIITRQHLTSPATVVDYFTGLLIDGQLTSDRRQKLIDTLSTSGGNGDTLQLAGGGNLNANSLRTMLYLLLTSPEYQLN